MSGMARVHLWSRGAFTSRGAKPNGLEFDAHGLNKCDEKGRLSYFGSWVSPFCLCIEIWQNLRDIVTKYFVIIIIIITTVTASYGS